MKKNIFKEASEKYNDFKDRGLIPSDKKNVYRTFIKEVAAERKGETFEGEYTAKGYSKRLGIKVDYFTGEDMPSLTRRYLEHLLESYKSEFLEIIDKNDFIKMAEKYGRESGNGGFNVLDILNVQNFLELSSLIKKAENVQLYLYRNIHGRNRQSESSMMEMYRDEVEEELRVLHNEIRMIIKEYEIY